MTTKITMPQLGESVAEGTVGRWLKQVGDKVRRDESLVEIITDKVTAELPSPVSGRLAKILVNEDQTVRVGTEIAEIEDEGAASAAAGATTVASVPQATAAPSAPSSPSSPSASTVSAPSPMPAAPAPAPTATAPAPASAGYPGNGSNGAASNGNNGSNGTYGAPVHTQERISPLARRLAQEFHVDLSAIQGTGESGRVRKEDILAFVEARDRTAPRVAAVSAPPPAAAQAAPTRPAPAPTAPPAAQPPAPPLTVAEGDELIPATPMRRMSVR